MKLTHLWVILLVCGMTGPQIANSKTIPFQLAGDLIIVKGWVNEQYGNYVLDTGVPGLILNSRYFDGKPSGHYLQGINGTIEAVEECFSKIRIGDYHWKLIYSEIIPMRILEDTKGIPIHGLLGSDFFRDYLLVIDYQNQLIDLLPLDNKGNMMETASSNLPTITLPFKMKGGAPLITVRIGGQEFRMTIDTGAEVNLIKDKYLEDLARIWSGQLLRTHLIGGLGPQGKRMDLVEIPDLEVGGFPCPVLEMGFTDLGQWNRSVYGPNADGILGYHFLQHFRLAINFKKRELHLWEEGKPFERLLASEKKK